MNYWQSLLQQMQQTFQKVLPKSAAPVDLPTLLMAENADVKGEALTPSAEEMDATQQALGQLFQEVTVPASAEALSQESAVAPHAPSSAFSSLLSENFEGLQFNGPAFDQQSSMQNARNMDGESPALTAFGEADNASGLSAFAPAGTVGDAVSPLSTSSESALKTATRSAQQVKEYEAFSTLHPVYTAPEVV